MGLDISAYSQIEKAKGNEAFDDTGELVDYDKWIQFYVNEDFPDVATGIDHGRAYTYKDIFHFYAGSYGGYNFWREDLAILAGYPASPGTSSKQEHSCAIWHGLVDKHAPFAELINFSDCEGTIDCTTSTKLLNDFRTFESKLETFEPRYRPKDYFVETYHNFLKAFEMASDNGCVVFC